MIIHKLVITFEWDEGNRDKNWVRHGVTQFEAEEVFFDVLKREYPDPVHSENEQRKIIVGKTKRNRFLFIVYTIRQDKVRIISARDINSKEKNL